MHKYSFSAMRKNKEPNRIERLERLAKYVESIVGKQLFENEVCLHFNDAKGDLNVFILLDHVGLEAGLRTALEEAVAQAWSAEGEDGADIAFKDVN